MQTALMPPNRKLGKRAARGANITRAPNLWRLSLAAKGLWWLTWPAAGGVDGVGDGRVRLPDGRLVKTIADWAELAGELSEIVQPALKELQAGGHLVREDEKSWLCPRAATYCRRTRAGRANGGKGGNPALMAKRKPASTPELADPNIPDWARLVVEKHGHAAWSDYLASVTVQRAGGDVSLIAPTDYAAAWIAHTYGYLLQEGFGCQVMIRAAAPA